MADAGGEQDDDGLREDGVRFSVDGVGEGVDSEDKMRLHRRDTPHHLKNKRINQQVDFFYCIILYFLLFKNNLFFLDKGTIYCFVCRLTKIRWRI